MQCNEPIYAFLSHKLNSAIFGGTILTPPLDKICIAHKCNYGSHMRHKHMCTHTSTRKASQALKSGSSHCIKGIPQRAVPSPNSGIHMGCNPAQGGSKYGYHPATVATKAISQRAPQGLPPWLVGNKDQLSGGSRKATILAS